MTNIKEVTISEDTRIVEDNRGGLHTTARMDEDGDLVTITRPHYEVHEAEMYSASYKTADGADLADNGSITMLIQTVNLEAHLTFNVECGGDADLYFYEDMSVSSPGSGITLVNYNRPDGSAADSRAYLAPTVTAWGTEIYRDKLIGGQKNQAFGGLIRADTEWILTSGTIYGILVTNRAGSGKPVSITSQHYED